MKKKLIQYYSNIDSSNTEAIRLLNLSKPENYTTVFTNYQSKGRGTKENKWFSDSGKNVLLSIIYYPRLNAQKQFLISMKTSLGIVSALNKLGLKTRIKWPNDIYAQNKKLAGILIENIVKSSIIETSIIGVGLNVNQELFPDNIENPISIRNINNIELDTSKIFHLIRDGIISELESNKDIKQRYLQNLYKFGEKESYIYKNQQIKATITDVLATGELILEKEDKTIIKCSFKEIVFITTPTP